MRIASIWLFLTRHQRGVDDIFGPSPVHVQKALTTYNLTVHLTFIFYFLVVRIVHSILRIRIRACETKPNRHRNSIFSFPNRLEGSLQVWGKPLDFLHHSLPLRAKTFIYPARKALYGVLIPSRLQSIIPKLSIIPPYIGFSTI